MPFKRNPMRYGHTPGYTHCAYAADGDKFLTCGIDGDIRIWSGVDDDDPYTQCVGELTVCVYQYAERILVSTDLNTVQAYTFPECDRDGTEFRFTGIVNCIKVNGKYMAACSEDMIIKVAPLGNSAEAFELSGHTGTVLKIDLSVKDLLASSSGDGTIRIWDLESKKTIKTIEGMPKTKSFTNAKTYATPSFDPKKGELLAYPKGKVVVVVDTLNFDTLFTLSDSHISSDYTTCEFSLCGCYIAAGTLSSELSIWNVVERTLVQGDTKGEEMNGISSISWNPTNNGEFVYCDLGGQLGLVENCYASTANVAAISNGKKVSNEIEDLYGDDGIEFGDDDNENCVSLEKLKNETLYNDPDKDDLDNVSLDGDRSSRATSRMSIDPKLAFKSFPLQPPFQPSSTPVHLEHRYLCWNSVGIVRGHRTDTEDTIDVEFHDAATHHGILMKNHLHHTMASLSSTVFALSCSNPCKLVCIALGAGGSREWSMDLSDLEEVTAISASEKLVAVVTSTRMLRLFGVMGNQREVISIPGPVVAVASHGSKVVVAYHASPASEDQHLKMLMVQTSGYTLRCRETTLPLSPNSTLEWIGLSDRGSPTSYDSSGIMRMYTHKSNVWIPVCDTSESERGISDNFFIVDVLESTQMVQAILCRGSRFPMTTPRPLVMEIPMKLPLLDLDSEKSRYEENLVRFSAFDAEDSNRIINENGIKLFGLACHSENEARAKELIEMIASPQLLQLAIKYANRLCRNHLAEKLSELLPDLEEQQRDRENIIEDNFEKHSANVVVMNMLAERKKSKTAEEFTPKPLVLSTSKRNPFKRGLVSTANKSTPKGNPLGHLTNKVVGFEREDDGAGVEPLPIAQSQDLFECEENTENQDLNKEAIKLPIAATPAAPLKFLDWFKSNKLELQKEYPEAIPSELTKLGMRKFKHLNSSAMLSKENEGDLSGGKRKFDEVEKRTEISNKFARFNFQK